jgi:hypothetical protein
MVYPKAEGFGKFLWEMRLDNIEENINFWKESKDPPHENFIEGLSQIIPALDIFLDTTSQDSENDEFRIIIYESVRLENGEIIRTSEKFHGKEWFSNVAITPAEDQEQYMSDKGAWYGKVSKF